MPPSVVPPSTEKKLPSLPSSSIAAVSANRPAPMLALPFFTSLKLEAAVGVATSASAAALRAEQPACSGSTRLHPWQ